LIACSHRSIVSVRLNVGTPSNKEIDMRARLTFAVLLAAAIAAATLSGRPVHATGDRDRPSPRHFSGLINDYTPSAAVVGGGPYEMRGKWSLDLDERQGTATFAAVMNMETSDYGIAQGTVNKDDPTTRGAHTHHMSMTDGVVTADWAASCPKFSPAVTDGFVVTGSAFVTGNGGGAPFGNPSPLTVCVLGGAIVKFSNITLTFGKPAANHFGLQAIHGVVARCTGRWEDQSTDCTVEE
jgi:hypothetical protein